jgi:hypothetical protein
MDLNVTCGTSCKAANYWPQGIPLAAGSSGTISYTVTVSRNHMVKLVPGYQLTLSGINVSNVVFT